MNIAQIEENVKALLKDLASDKCEQNDFIYDLLLAYGHRKQSVSRLRTGERNMASKNNTPRHDEIIWKRHLYYRYVEGNALHAEIDQMRKDKLVQTNNIRFIIVTNFDQLLAVDIKTSDSLDINLDELPKQFDFFLPWAGIEKAVYQGENPADVKAAEKMAKLFDLIKSDNFDESNRLDKSALHNLNVFLSRLLFCFFAEDTEIFKRNQFSLAIQSHTKDTGSDLSDYLCRLFTVLNTSENKRGELPDYLADFPYVNGGLFADDIPSPVFTAKTRRLLLECGSELHWSDINPDIFGSMFQAVVHPDQRGGMGMHYTSVTNIMKVIEPLFLNDLYAELDKVEGSATKLQKFQQRLGNIKIFDPACGSGNFLIIAYKELRKLEMEVLKRLQELDLRKSGQILQPFSVITLSQFYGIELDDFAHEVAILSLWLAEHQMNVEFKAEFGDCSPSLPLLKSGNIVCANALNVEWTNVCSADGEVYIVGNPPYVGSKKQSKTQKEDMRHVFENQGRYKDLDYVTAWFMLAAKFIEKSGNKYAFVATSSINQGELLAELWPKIFSKGLEIFFANRNFSWRNNAKAKASVICSIIGVRGVSNKPKYIFESGRETLVKNINAYLLDGKNVIVSNVKKQISNLSPISGGNQALDGTNLIISTELKSKAISENKKAEKYFLPYMGADDFINGKQRWCIWIEDEDLQEASNIEFICNQIKAVKKYRENGGIFARTFRDKPHRFVGRHRAEHYQLAIPQISSERRRYLPIGFFQRDVIFNHKVFVMYDPDLYVLALLSSLMHMTWVRAVGGRLKTDINYSSKICYNNFPVPDLSSDQREGLTNLTLKILSARERYPDKNLAYLYDPEKMPKDLKLVHEENDLYVDYLYNVSGFSSESSRLESLFDLYISKDNVNAKSN
jgi:hypothetical protein